MSLSIQHTNDGSKTLYSKVFKETYHSINGAVTESLHVFIDAGFKSMKKSEITILEIGFGTGLNALLTLLEAQHSGIVVNYESVELYPLESEVYDHLNYEQLLPSSQLMLKAMHDASWNKEVAITANFRLHKVKEDLLHFSPTTCFDLIYFDAFSPATQPELWTEDIFRKTANHTNEGGVLTTYCAKGAVRRTLQKVGFTTERLPGPPGKREMLRATKHVTSKAF